MVNARKLARLALAFLFSLVLSLSVASAWMDTNYLYRVPFSATPNQEYVVSIRDRYDISTLVKPYYDDVAFECSNGNIMNFTRLYTGMKTSYFIVDGDSCGTGQFYMYFGNYNSTYIGTSLTDNFDMFAHNGIGDTFEDGWINTSKWSSSGFIEAGGTLSISGYKATGRLYSLSGIDSDEVTVLAQVYGNNYLFNLTIGDLSVVFSHSYWESSPQEPWCDTIPNSPTTYTDFGCIAIFVDGNNVKTFSLDPNTIRTVFNGWYFIKVNRTNGNITVELYDSTLSSKYDTNNYVAGSITFGNPSIDGKVGPDSSNYLRLYSLAFLSGFDNNEMVGNISSYDPQSVCSYVSNATVTYPYIYDESGFLVNRSVLDESDTIIYKDGLILPFYDAPYQNSTSFGFDGYIVRDLKANSNETIKIYSGCGSSSYNKYATSYISTTDFVYDSWATSGFSQSIVATASYRYYYLYESLFNVSTSSLIHVSSMRRQVEPHYNSYFGVSSGSDYYRLRYCSSFGSCLSLDNVDLLAYFDGVYYDGNDLYDFDHFEGLLAYSYPTTTSIQTHDSDNLISLSDTIYDSFTSTSGNVEIIETYYYVSNYWFGPKALDIFPFGIFSVNVSNVTEVPEPVQEQPPSGGGGGGGGAFFAITPSLADLLVSYDAKLVDGRYNVLINMTLVNTSTIDTGEVTLYYPDFDVKKVMLIPDKVSSVEFSVPESDKILVNITTKKLGIKKSLNILSNDSDVYEQTSAFGAIAVFAIITYALKKLRF